MPPISPATAPWLAIVTVLSLLFYLSTSIAVARARAVHKVQAPAVSGHPVFERAMRVQANTLEWLAIYLPSLWLFAVYVDGNFAVALGVLWIGGRILYMRGYLIDAAKRGPGFIVQAAATMVLALGALSGAVVKLVAPHG